MSYIVIAVATLAAISDLRTRKIPNALTFGAALGALVYHTVMHGGPGLLSSAGGWIVGAAVFFPIFALGGMGAGDVKLVAALGAWLGPIGALYVAAGSAIAGGLVAVLVSLRSRYLTIAVMNVFNLLSFFRQNGIRPMPEMTLATSSGPRLAYAVPILLGTLGTLWLR